MPQHGVGAEEERLARRLIKQGTRRNRAEVERDWAWGGFDFSFKWKELKTFSGQMGRRRKEGDARERGVLQRGRGSLGPEPWSRGEEEAGILKSRGRGSWWRGFCSWSAEEEGL